MSPEQFAAIVDVEALRNLVAEKLQTIAEKSREVAFQQR